MDARRFSLLAAVLALGMLVALHGRPAPAAAASPLTRSPDGRPLILTFDDEFDNFRRWRDGQGVWRTTFRNGKAADEFSIRTLKWNGELELYVDPDFRPRGRPLGLNPFTVRNGVLEIAATPAPASAVADLRGFRYVSGLITTEPSFRQTYGYFEMRAKLPGGKGVWPGFWLLPSDFSWPPEIDIMESVGDPSKYYVTLHTKAAPKDPGTEVRITPEAFHVFAVSWDRREVIWFLDGREVKRLPTPADMHKPMFILANVALGGGWAGAPDASTPFPAKLKIDYIRAYRFGS